MLQGSGRVESGTSPVGSALLIMATATMWGTVAVIVKVMVREIDPALIAFVRMLLGGAALTIALALTRGRIVPRRSWRLVAVGAVGIAFNYLFFTFGLRYTSASAGAMVVQAEVIFLAALSVVFLKEPFGARKVAGMAIALAGVVIISWNGKDLSSLLGSDYLLGNVIIVLGGLFWAFYALSQKRLGQDREVLSSLSPIFLLSALILLPFALGSVGDLARLTGVEVLGLLYLGLVCTGLAYLLLAKGMKAVAASTAGVLTTLMPVSSVILAHIFLGEGMSLYMGLGAALDLGGIVLVLRG